MFEKRCFFCGGKIRYGEYKLETKFLLKEKLVHESCWRVRHLEECMEKIVLVMDDKFIKKSDIKDYIEKELGITTKW
jgi:hypothetical protein